MKRKNVLLTDMKEVQRVEDVKYIVKPYLFKPDLFNDKISSLSHSAVQTWNNYVWPDKVFHKKIYLLTMTITI